MFLLDFLITHDDDPMFVVTALTHCARHAPQEKLIALFAYLDTYRENPDATRQSILL